MGSGLSCGRQVELLLSDADPISGHSNGRLLQLYTRLLPLWAVRTQVHEHAVRVPELAKQDILMDPTSLFNNSENIFFKVVSGSVAETLSLPQTIEMCPGKVTVEGYDTDTLWLDLRFRVAVNYQASVLSKTHLHLVNDYSVPGFVRIRCTDPVAQNLNPYLKRCVGCRGEPVYYLTHQIRTLFLKHALREKNAKGAKICGPAVTTETTGSVKGSNADVQLVIPKDDVYSIACTEWTGDMDKWSRRVQGRPWPLESTVRQICDMYPLVVPVSHRMTDPAVADIEWRFSFSLAEVALARSLTDIQRQAYMLFKYICKWHLKGHKAFSTYLFKTTLFWVCEKLPPSCWRTQGLTVCINALLDQFTAFLVTGKIPNYFFPHINLIGFVSRDHVRHALKIITQIRRDPIKFAKETHKHQCFPCNVYVPLEPAFVGAFIDANYNSSMYVQLNIDSVMQQFSNGAVDDAVESVLSGSYERAVWQVNYGISLHYCIAPASCPNVYGQFHWLCRRIPDTHMIVRVLLCAIRVYGEKEIDQHMLKILLASWCYTNSFAATDLQSGEAFMAKARHIFSSPFTEDKINNLVCGTELYNFILRNPMPIRFDPSLDYKQRLVMQLQTILNQINQTFMDIILNPTQMQNFHPANKVFTLQEADTLEPNIGIFIRSVGEVRMPYQMYLTFLGACLIQYHVWEFRDQWGMLPDAFTVPVLHNLNFLWNLLDQQNEILGRPDCVFANIPGKELTLALSQFMLGVLHLNTRAWMLAAACFHEAWISVPKIKLLHEYWWICMALSLLNDVYHGNTHVIPSKRTIKSHVLLQETLQWLWKKRIEHFKVAVYEQRPRWESVTSISDEVLVHDVEIEEYLQPESAVELSFQGWEYVVQGTKSHVLVGQQRITREMEMMKGLHHQTVTEKLNRETEALKRQTELIKKKIEEINNKNKVSAHSSPNPLEGNGTGDTVPLDLELSKVTLEIIPLLLARVLGVWHQNLLS